MENKKIRVLVVDDSALVREVLSGIINKDPALEVMGTAEDPYVAVKMIKDEIPDVITLDIEMPRMDGLSFLKKIMSQHPIPTIVISTLSVDGSDAAIKALEYGAVDVFAKNELKIREGLEEISQRLCFKIKAAANATVARRGLPKSVKPKIDQISKQRIFDRTKGLNYADKILAIGASTGGTEAIRNVLESLTHETQGVVIVQHMPPLFTTSFAKRLNELCSINVMEAQEGMEVLKGHAYIADGAKHLSIRKAGDRYVLKSYDGPLVNRHRPSVDVLFESVAQQVGNKALGVILTGMGADGAAGLLKMREAGAHTIAQSESTCIVYGMPKKAVELNAAVAIINLQDIAKELNAFR